MYTYPKLSRGMSGNDGNDGSGDDKRDDKPHDTQQSSFVYWILGGLAFFVLGGLAALLRALINVARSQRLVPPPPAQGDTTQENPTGPTQPGSSSSPGSSSPGSSLTGSSSTGRKREVAGQPKPKTTLKDLDHEEHASLSTIPESLTSHAAPIATPELSLSDKDLEDGGDKVEEEKVDDKPKDDSDEGIDGDGDQHESPSTTPPAPVSDELEKTNSPSKDHSLETSHESNQTGETVKVDEDQVNRSTDETQKPNTTITSPPKSESPKAAKTDDDDSNDDDKSQTGKDTNNQEESSH